jgi:hypothetical protein
MNNTIILFLSLADNSNNESPLESNIRRTAFIYSPLLKLTQRVSNQIVHVIDFLPTLVNATSLKWQTKERIDIDGINQWQALNANDEERLDVYGDNFYISNYWKLSIGVNDSSDFYGSIENELMENDKDITSFDFDTYFDSISSSDLHNILRDPKLLHQKIMLMRSRARVHCNLKDIDEDVVKGIRCSRSSPCLFDLIEDPCEFDNKMENEFDFRREHMREILERFLNGESISDISSRSTTAAAGIDVDAMVGIILSGTVVACILVFIVVVCAKEKCNRKRSVYFDKSKKKTVESSSSTNGNDVNGNSSNNPNAISVIS